MNPQNYNNLGLCSKILLNVKKKEIDSEDFRDLKSDYSVIIEKLEAKLYSLSKELLGIEPLLDEGISRLLKLNYIGKLDEKGKNRICQDDLPEMRDLISTIYPQKLTCEKGDQVKKLGDCDKTICFALYQTKAIKWNHSKS